MKKLLSLILSVGMILTTLFVPTVSAVNDDYGYAINLLQGDETGDLMLDSTITRAQFATVMVRALGATVNGNMATQYPDVASEHWGSGYINYATQYGIINGYEDGTFKPEEPVKYEEAVKMIMMTLGYEPFAKNNGGYPNGYLLAAARSGVTSGVVSGVVGQPATRETVIKLLDNALETPLMGEATWTFNGEDEYTIYNGKGDYEKRTLLSEYLDIAKVKAKVVATIKGGIDGEDTLDKADEIKLSITSLVGFDGLKDVYFDGDYNKGEEITVKCDVKDLLGYNVIAFIGKDDNDDHVVKAIYVDNKKSATLNLADWIDNVELKNDVYEITYYPDGDTFKDAEEIELDVNASMNYNGTAIGTISDYDGDFISLLKEANEVIVMMSSSDDVYTSIFVTEYDYDMVVEVNSEDETIDTENGFIDLSDKDLVYHIYYDGEEIGIEDLEENDVLNIVWQDAEDRADNSDYVDIYVTRDIVEGEVTGITEDEYVINGEAYKALDGVSLDLGDEGTFYLTIDGKIFDRIVEHSSKNYGFITKVDNNTFMNETEWYIEMLTADGRTDDYTIASTVKVNKTSLKNEAKNSYFTNLQILDLSTDTIENRFIAYTLNSKNEIVTILDATSGEFDSNSKSGTYNPTTNKFAGYYYENTSVIFAAPANESGMIDLDNVEIVNINSLDEDESYDAYIFDTDKNKNFRAAVITTDIIPTGVNNALAVVTGKISGTNNAGDEADGISIIQGKDKFNIYSGDNTEGDFDTLEKGDIIFFSCDGNNDLKKVTKVFTIATGTLEITNSKDYSFICGNTEEVKSAYVTIDGEDYTFSKDDVYTYALIDTTKAGTKSYVTAINTLKESTNKKIYYSIIKLNDDEEIIDVIQVYYEIDNNPWEENLADSSNISDIEESSDMIETEETSESSSGSEIE